MNKLFQNTVLLLRLKIHSFNYGAILHKIVKSKSCYITLSIFEQTEHLKCYRGYVLFSENRRITSLAISVANSH